MELVVWQSYLYNGNFCISKRHLGFELALRSYDVMLCTIPKIEIWGHDVVLACPVLAFFGFPMVDISVSCRNTHIICIFHWIIIFFVLPLQIYKNWDFIGVDELSTNGSACSHPSPSWSCQPQQAASWSHSHVSCHPAYHTNHSRLGIFIWGMSDQ